MQPPTVGLFGTCGRSQWRHPFLRRYESLGIPYFNPQVEQWDPSFGRAEAWHLAHDEIILFPVTDETLSLGPLAELGFSIVNTLCTHAHRFVVIYVAPTVSAQLAEQDPVGAQESNRARALVRAHLRAQSSPTVFMVEDLQTLFEVSVMLHGVLQTLASARGLANREAPRE